ncbi:MAG TPA: amidase [Thermoleophilaceae bacterium]|nr:amidase [Thermoleophilaceae bacterium]
MDPHLDATAQADLVRAGEVSPRELVETSIERIEALNGDLNAVIHPLFEQALETEPADGPFRGVPFVVKDLICSVEGTPHHEGMRFLKELGHRADADSWLASRFRKAGFVFVGKTNTPELGILPTTEPLAYGPSRNPWDTSRSTGGSSGGSGAAVASGMVAIGHANDGGGSIRIPASCNGLVGLKATRARVSMAPLGDFASGLGTELVVSRSVRDTAAVLDWCCEETPPGEPYFAPPRERPYAQEVGADPGRLRIGLMTSAPAGMCEMDPDCVAAAEEAAKALESLGHSVERSHPPALDDEGYIENFLVRWTSAVAAGLDFWSLRTGRPIGPDDVEPATWALAEQGRTHSGARYLMAVGYAQLITRSVIEWWQSFDVLLTPTMAVPPAELGTIGSGADDPDPAMPIARAIPYAVYTAGFNATGQPAISLPLHWTDGGLPIGVQLVGNLGREDLLIRVASQLEEARPWAERRPPVFAAAAR